MTPQEFQRRYLPLTPRLYAVAFDLLRSAQDAEDAVQDVYLRLWPMADRLERMERHEAFFFRTLRHLCMDRLNYNSRFVDADAADVTPSSDDTSLPPDLRFETGDQWHYLMLRLPPKARRLMFLRSRGDYTTTELATIMHESEDNVRAILSRARRMLRQWLVQQS